MAAESFVRGPVDREDGTAKTSLSTNFSLRVLGRSRAGLFGCRSLPLAVTYLHYINQEGSHTPSTKPILGNFQYVPSAQFCPNESHCRLGTRSPIVRGDWGRVARWRGAE